MSDPVNHPAHYCASKDIECIDAIRAALTVEEFVGHCRACAIKYSWRGPHKGAPERDCQKAQTYLRWAEDALAGRPLRK